MTGTIINFSGKVAEATVKLMKELAAEHTGQDQIDFLTVSIPTGPHLGPIESVEKCLTEVDCDWEYPILMICPPTGIMAIATAIAVRDRSGRLPLVVDPRNRTIYPLSESP